MKKVLTYLIVIVIFSTSCSNDKLSENSHLLGTWKLTEWTLSSPIDLNNDDFATASYSPGCLLDSQLEFIDESNGTIFYSSNVSYYTREENNALIYMISCIKDSENIPIPTIYYTEDDKIIVSSDGNISIFKLENNKLILTVPSGFNAKDIDTLEVTKTLDVTYIFTKE